jgi:heterodisulfide reductase subunit B2
MTYMYYPGCSLKSTGKPYEESLLAVFRALNVELREIDDWNCCGATAYVSIDEKKAFALASRNLALAEQQHGSTNGTPVDLVAPCSACFLVLTKSQKYFQTYPEVREDVTRALAAAELDYKGRTRVRHPLDVMVNDIGLDRIRARATSPMKGIRVVSYYGCQVVRPFATFDDAMYPTSMDRLMTAAGATAVDWPLKTRCCGGSLTGTIPDAGLRLNQHLLVEAARRKADVVVTCCPLCQFNMECFQSQINSQYGENIHLPVMYFTQFLGLAFGLTEKELGIQRLFVKPDFRRPAEKGAPAHV